MYDFYGQYKTGANVSLGGSSKKVNKSDLLQSARAERYKREQTRRENNAALLIQSWYHGCKARKALAEEKRSHFTVQLTGYKSAVEGGSDGVLAELVTSLCLFYRHETDYQRLVSLCQILLKLVSSKKLGGVMSTDQTGWVHRIKKLLIICCRSLHTGGDTNITIPLRMLEVFTHSDTYNWLDSTQANKISLLVTIYLVLKGYFKDLYRLIDTKIPSSLEPSATPPTPFAHAAKDWVLKPLTTLHKHHNSEAVDPKQSSSVYTTFVKHMLSPPMSPQVCYFIVPAVSPSIPLTPLLRAVDSVQEGGGRGGRGGGGGGFGGGFNNRNSAPQ